MRAGLKPLFHSSAWLLIGGLLTGAAQAADATNLGEAFTQGNVGFALRWRLEHVEQDAFDNDATAIPLRLRLNFGTAPLKGFKLFAEYDYVHDFGLNDYNEGGGNTPDRVNHPVIADPAGGDLNQAWLQYRSALGNQLRLGRQRIIYDNARFIGNVGWRQNEQTYDAVHFEREGWREWNIRAGYIDRVRRIFGNDVPAGKHDMNTWLVNLSRPLGDAGRLTGYLYDIDNDSAPGLSNRSYGLRFTGQREQLGYTLEYAHQVDTGNAPLDYSAEYWRVDLSWAFDPVTLFGGYERLDGNAQEPGKAFRTPLATLHAFNGWADQFLATPNAGLDDRFAGLRGKVGAWSWTAIYHDFEAADGPGGFGSEWDASLQRKFGERFGLLFKGAWFDSRHAGYTDTTKLWVMLTADLR